MAHNKLYRNFIILQEDENSHFGSVDKLLSGYAKIEAKSDKCKISFYAQNLKKDEKYTIVLICYKKEVKQIVDLGALEVNEVGKGEAIKEYYINDIAGLNFSYEKISGAAICKHKNEQLSFLMYGFMNNENIKEDWKKMKIVKCYDKNKIAPKYEKPIKEDKDKDEYKKEEHKVEKCDKEDEKKSVEHKHHEDKDDECCKHKEHDEKYDHHKDKDDDCKYKEHDHDYKDKDKDDEECKHKEHEHKEHEHEDHKDKDDECCKHKEHDYDDDHHEEKHHKHNEDYECNENCKRSVEEDNEDEETNEVTTQKDFDEYEESVNVSRENQEIDPYDFNVRGAVGDFFDNIVKGFEEVKGKFKEIKYCKWYKIKINSIDDMCNTADYNKYTVAYYPMLNYYPYIKKYGYFFIGYKCDSKGDLKYIVYGIPGNKDKDDQPYVGKTGFVTWISSDDGKVGCWLMFYDYKNSNIVVPMK